jgi:anti-anti-sigma regulatory factor
MASKHSNRHNRDAKAKQERSVEPAATPAAKQILIDVERSGDWMVVEDLRGAALAALKLANDVTINLGRLDHLDASSLQILLALDAEQKKRGKNLQLANASLQLAQWFEFAGTADRFAMIGNKSDE